MTEPELAGSWRADLLTPEYEKSLYSGIRRAHAPVMTTAMTSVSEVDAALSESRRQAKSERVVAYCAIAAAFFTIVAAQFFVEVVNLGLTSDSVGTILQPGTVSNYFWLISFSLTAAAASSAYGLYRRRNIR